MLINPGVLRRHDAPVEWAGEESVDRPRCSTSPRRAGRMGPLKNLLIDPGVVNRHDAPVEWAS